MRDTIILCGGFNLATSGASAIRAIGLAQMFQRLGYKVVVLGKLGEKSTSADPYETHIQDVPCRDIRHPVAGPKPATYVTSSTAIASVVEDIGTAQVKAVLLYNYPARGAIATIRYCRSQRIATILDCTEWPIWEGHKILRNIHRLIGIEVRMRLLTRLSGNVICASKWLQSKMNGLNTARLPFTLDTSQSHWQKVAPTAQGGPPRLIYSGSPGVGMIKDRLPPMVAALAALKREGVLFECDIAGITAPQYLEMMPDHKANLADLGDGLRFLGRISHDASLALLRQAHFSVFFRKSNRVSNAGFATKMVEAKTLGIPVITNVTSDIPMYLRDGENGFLANDLSEETVAATLKRAIEQSEAERQAMRDICQGENPFEIAHWTKATANFLNNLRGTND